MNPALKLLEIAIMTISGLWNGVRQDLNLLELAAIGVAVYAWKKRGWRPRGIPAIRAWRHPAFIATGIVFAAIPLRLALIPLLPVPVPYNNDEFSHLLLADTLAHGRVTNPTHPFWQHFESVHIIQQPHYVSNYFPGHALFLAAGKIVLASPWAGVLAEYGMFLGALYWALRGWMPPRWALVGIVLATVRFGIGSYWINAYHGGFLAAFGGALVFGAFPRLRTRFNTNGSPGESAVLGLVFGAGLAALASTRPYEGVAYAIPFVATLLWEGRKQISALALTSAAACAIVLPALVGLGIYFQHVTGSPFVTAYQVSQKTYGWPMALAWTPPPKIQHRHIEMQHYFDYEIGEHEKVKGPVGLIEYLTFRMQEYWRFFFGPLLTIPLLMLGRVWRRRPFLLVAAAGGIAAILLEGAASPHYLAPATAALVAIAVEGLRYFDGMKIRLAPLLIGAMVLVLAIRIGLEQAGAPYSQKYNFQSWCCRAKNTMDKERLTAELLRLPGNHLVFVKPQTRRDIYQWIYNDAEIDAARIVWARDMGDVRNAELAQYFASRKVWFVDPTVEPATMTPYNVAGSDRVNESKLSTRPVAAR